MSARLQVIKSETIYQGKIVSLKLDQVVEPDGVKATREVVHHGGSVVLLPRFPDGTVLLVRQYRYAVRKALWELVAGGIDRGESIAQAARRELMEETGYKARVLKPLFQFYPSPGILTERMHLLQAEGLTQYEAQPEEDEKIGLGRFTAKEIARMLRTRRIEDGKTLVGLLWLISQQES